MKFDAEYWELNLWPTFQKLPQKCAEKKIERKSCWDHKPNNMSLWVQPLLHGVLPIFLMTIDQEKGDLGVIIAKNQVIPRTRVGKSMGNQQIGSRHILKMIAKAEDTMSLLRITQHHLIPIRLAKSNCNCCKKCTTSSNRGQIPPILSLGSDPQLKKVIFLLPQK